jgi:hypothetical protein
MHGRTVGVGSDLCDVCYWRYQVELERKLTAVTHDTPQECIDILERKVAALEAENAILQRLVDVVDNAHTAIALIKKAWSDYSTVQSEVDYSMENGADTDYTKESVQMVWDSVNNAIMSAAELFTSRIDEQRKD